MGVYQGTAGAVGMAFVSDVAQILVDIVDPGTSLVFLKPRCRGQVEYLQRVQQHLRVTKKA